MAGLIPLMLASSNRTSLIGNAQAPSRRQSAIGSSATSAVSTASTSPTSPTNPTNPSHAARPKPPKRLSISAPAALPVLPYTQAEWRRAIAEVKRKYFGKRYRACSARCLEILDGIKDTSQVEPVYLIYLHFYAATSIEICARPLPSTSPFRANLLLQARTHFDRAASLINAAEESMLRKFRPYSASSSRASSTCHSPSGSISSRAWTPDTHVSSPTTSVCSFGDNSSAGSPQSPPKRVKKVSFSLPKEGSLHIAPEPIIRPDSPTLGFETGYFQFAAPQQELPDLHPAPKFQEIELPLQTIPEDEAEDEAENEVEDREDENTYFVARSVSRCCEHLSSLRAQLARHSTSLDQLLSSAAASQSQSDSESESASEPTTKVAPCSGAGDARTLDRQARIERLRRNGWQRKRFDARRYEELREAVLAELA
ncbi:hypothetical protein C8A03DRAFT_45291 [Achaetomium macrosporum]|uniref:Uncharacterized protein n=1 Tax=Achaetomium macrosporum TaxID=79813 RepID=A0AAN7H9Q2_9PEZI|nr:hypothetical protein C8A03DRAFT_45291 [Achaetomium macrosporum]